MDDGTFPRFRPVADHGVLVEFGDRIDEAVNARVRRLDAALAAAPVAGVVEIVPANVNLMVFFDPLATDHAAVERAVAALLDAGAGPAAVAATREVLVCYDGDCAPDLAAVAAAKGLSVEAVIAAHLAGDYTVHMYGFAPGYAYLSGVPEAIRLPRKPAPVRGRPPGSLVMAGPQCQVTTQPLPTGWWVIGRSPTRILREDDGERPFLFDVGDHVRFRRIDRATFDRELHRG